MATVLSIDSEWVTVSDDEGTIQKIRIVGLTTADEVATAVEKALAKPVKTHPTVESVQAALDKKGSKK